jgi:asparagine synthase (glutamine-hydrolysing)
MCGIVTVINPNVNIQQIVDNFKKGEHRGPDNTTFNIISPSVWMGFHRLAINGLSNLSNQPFHIDGIHLVCNGEIYNYKKLYDDLNIQPTTESDCEVIIHLYKLYGIDETMRMINASECSFVLYDSNQEIIYAVRDTYGVRPLYHSQKETMHLFSSEIKMVNDLNVTTKHHKPGTITKFFKGVEEETYSYTNFPVINPSLNNGHVCSLIRQTLYDCVRERVVTTQRKVACLLSGGLDSSIITMLVKKVWDELGCTEPLETYSIGLEGAEDLKYATLMAEFLNTKHTNIIVSEEDFFNAIPEVIYNIESYDTTSVRASVGNYLVCKEISKISDAKVIFNGDGSDEVTGGYLYLKKCPNMYEFDAECRRLVSDIYLFDALRSDKGPSSNGLEARTPFLDPKFVQLYLSLPPEIRFNSSCEKFLLRTSFQDMLPNNIAWRKKEAFSDGVSSLQRSWYQIIQEKIPSLYDDLQNHSYTFNKPTTPEQLYYRMIFESHYKNMENVVPYMWMPKYSSTKDCSARTLEIYIQN